MLKEAKCVQVSFSYGKLGKWRWVSKLGKQIIKFDLLEHKILKVLTLEVLKIFAGSCRVISLKPLNS